MAVSTMADLIDRLEFQHMRRVAEMVCRAALRRAESRGSHFRRDHPAEDDRRWRKNIEIRKGSSGMELREVPVGKG